MTELSVLSFCMQDCYLLIVISVLCAMAYCIVTLRQCRVKYVILLVVSQFS